MNSLLGVVAAHLANGHEGTEGIEQVLIEVGAWNILNDPFHIPVMEERIITIGIEGVIPFHFRHMDGGLLLAG